MAERIKQRSYEGRDASDATVEVMERQQENQIPIPFLESTDPLCLVPIRIRHHRACKMNCVTGYHQGCIF